MLGGEDRQWKHRENTRSWCNTLVSWCGFEQRGATLNLEVTELSELVTCEPRTRQPTICGAVGKGGDRLGRTVQEVTTPSAKTPRQRLPWQDSGAQDGYGITSDGEKIVGHARSPGGNGDQLWRPLQSGQGSWVYSLYHGRWGEPSKQMCNNLGYVSKDPSGCWTQVELLGEREERR